MIKKKFVISIILSILLITGCNRSLKTDSTDKDPINSTSANQVDTKTDSLSPVDNTQESGIKDYASHSGEFSITMSGYKGELFIGISNDRFYGTIKFFNWGNGVPQPLIDLKVSEDKIYFKRVIKTKEDLIKYGGTAYFEQDFYGIFSADKKIIKGYYRYIGTQDNWQAVKK